MGRTLHFASGRRSKAYTDPDVKDGGRVMPSGRVSKYSLGHQVPDHSFDHLRRSPNHTRVSSSIATPNS